MNFLFKRLAQPVRLSFQSKPEYFFSVSNISQEETIELHKSIIASRAIQKIIIPPKLFSVNQDQFEQKSSYDTLYPSLRSTIIRIIEQYSVKQENQTTCNQMKDTKEKCLETAKKDMLDFFVDGIYVDQNLVTQTRILDQNEGIFLFDKIKPEIIFNKKKVAFCPTYLVTGNIFRAILQSKQNQVLTGYFGTGKTYSFLLYHFLTDVIYRYIHKYCKERKNLHPQIKKFPKLIYFSVDFNQLQKCYEKEIINQVIMKQCYEITSVYPTYNFIQQIDGQVDSKKFYEGMGIETKIVIDQIQAVASAVRNKYRYSQMLSQLRRNKDYQKIEQLAKNDPQKKKQLKDLDRELNLIISLKLSDPQIIENYDLANEVLKIVSILRNNFGNVIYLSPRTFEPYLTRYMNLNGQQSHKPISQIGLQFNKFLETPQNISDIAEFFVILLTKIYKLRTNKIRLTDNQQRMIPKIKQIMCHHFQKGNLIILPYVLRFMMHNFSTQEGSYQFNEIIKSIFHQENQNNLEQQIQKFIDIINEKSTSQFEFILRNFFNKRVFYDPDLQEVKKQKRIFMLKLLYAVKEKIHSRGFQTDQGDKCIVIQASPVFNLIRALLQTRIKTIFKTRVTFITDENTFYLTTNQYAIIKILQAEEKKILEVLLKFNQNVYSLIQTKVSKRLYIESLIRHCLLEPQTQFKIQLQVAENNYYQKIYSLSNGVDRKLMFNSIPFIASKNYDEYHFLKSFKIEQTNESDFLGTCLFLPAQQKVATFKTAKFQKKIDETSKKIDFVLTQYQRKDVSISAFNVTIQKEKALQKITDFFYEFSNFEDKQQQTLIFGKRLPKQKTVQLRYIILVPQILRNPIQWKNHVEEAINKLNQDILQQKKKNNFSLEKIGRFEKRIMFLRNLTDPKHFIEQNYSLEIKKSKKLKSLLRQIHIVSFFDAKFENKSNPESISIYKELLKQAQIQYYKENSYF